MIYEQMQMEEIRRRERLNAFREWLSSHVDAETALLIEAETIDMNYSELFHYSSLVSTTTIHWESAASLVRHAQEHLRTPMVQYLEAKYGRAA